jgi:type IV pilus assembly protein PilN
MKKFLESLNQPVKLPFGGGGSKRGGAKPTASEKAQMPARGTVLNKPLRLPFRQGGQGETSTPLPPQAPPPTAQMLTAGWTPPLDLLRERRRELELEPVSGLLLKRPALFRRGLVGGGLLLGASLGLCGLLLFWHQMLKARMGELERYEADVEQLTTTLKGHQGALKKQQASNEGLVKRLTDVRSSSALLADLQLRVPEGVQITAVQMEGTNAIKLEGVAREPMAFGRVNAMELVLRQSPLIAATGVTLGKVERVPAQQLAIQAAGPAKPGAPQQRLELPSAVSFAMSATLTPLAANRLVAVMEGLQADGMVRRLELLQREGLLK